MAPGISLEESPDLVSPVAAWVYRYRIRSVGWLIEGHHRIRETLRRALPRLVWRDVYLTERSVEQPFVLRRLRAPRGSRVLDLGSVSSLTPLHLAALGLRACAVDIRPYPLANPEIDRVIADIRRLGFRDGSFDAATAISTIEHLGLGAYGDAPSEAGDRKAMAEIRRVLRPDGQLLLTVPFGQRGLSELQRSYDHEALSSLLAGFRVQTVEFFLRNGDAWTRADLEPAGAVESATRTTAVALVDAQRAP